LRRVSNYVTGQSTNMVCSPAAEIRYEEDADHNLTTKLGLFTIDRFSCAESAGYPTICKGRYFCGQFNDAYCFAERLIGSIRRECTDHLIVFGEEHLRRTLAKYSSYYNPDSRFAWEGLTIHACNRAVRRDCCISDP
jgi:hypothetical protein